MKKLLYSLIIASFFSVTSYAQTAIKLNYGVRKPAGNDISNAFKSTDGFSLTFLQKKKATWAYGATFTTQKFCSDNYYFNAGYQARMRIDQFMLSSRKDIKLKEDRVVYWGIDLGMLHYKLCDNKLQNNKANSGLATAFVIGSRWPVTRNFAIDIHGSYNYNYTGDIEYSDKFTASRFKFWGLNFGIKYSFRNIK